MVRKKRQELARRDHSELGALRAPCCFNRYHVLRLKYGLSLFEFIGLKWGELFHLNAVCAICNPWTEPHPATPLNLEKVRHGAPSTFIIKSFLPGFAVQKEAVTLRLTTSKSLCFNLLKRILMQDGFIQGVFRQRMLFLKQRSKYLSCCRLTPAAE